MSDRLLLKPDAVFIGSGGLQRGWSVLVDGDSIVAAGPAAQIGVPADVVPLELRGTTLLPGLIDLHSHVLLSPYERMSWDDQVLREPQALRVARAINALRAALRAGFTTLRDLGTEGAGYSDVGLKAAVAQGVIPGPRLLVATRAIVATGSYGPAGFAPECGCPAFGAQEAGGIDALTFAVRDQIRRGADWIKVYADSPWGPHGEPRPTFTLAELKLVVELAESSGRHVAAHSTTAEGMRRATLAGVRTIEHGDAGTAEIFALMAEREVAFCPTIAAYEVLDGYASERKHASLSAALEAGVVIVNGSDAGVFPHGDNVRELEALVRYGLTAQEALEAATSRAAKTLDLDDTLGAIGAGRRADVIAVTGDPLESIGALRNVELVMLGGAIYDDDDG